MAALDPLDPGMTADHRTEHLADQQRQYRWKLIEGLTFEVVPMSGLDEAIDALPPASEVSVTCSPVKGIAETMRRSDQLRSLGHTPIPHIAARMVESRTHVAEIARWLRSEQIGRMFLVGGDATPAGPYTDAASFLRDLLEAGPALHAIGVTAYPDGHSAIDSAHLSQALHDKQAILDEAGIVGYASTQMCFDPGRITSWLTRERRNGFDLPVHLGVAGVVDRTKLMTMGARLGIGTSLSFLRKNRRAIGKLMTQGGYDPDTLLDPLAPDLEALRVSGLHCFTFNQVEATEAWRSSAIGSLQPRH